MERTPKRAWRRVQQKRVWRNRIRYYANQGNQILDPDTHQYLNPRDWKEYKSVPWMKVLKTTATPCSCWMCRNYLYNRLEFKRDTRCMISEQADI